MEINKKYKFKMYFKILTRSFINLINETHKTLIHLILMKLIYFKMKQIHKTFKSKVKKYLMVLFCRFQAQIIIITINNNNNHNLNTKIKLEKLFHS